MSDDLSNFGGVARLFPLPNLVLFPHVVQPLHIFEPRYRQMTADAIDGDSLITLALLRSGEESESDEKPELHPMACLARIVAHKQLDDGRYILLVRGLQRVRILEEIPSDRPYRSARVEIVDEVMVMPIHEARETRERLAELILPRFTGSASERKQVEELLEGETPLGALCDVLCFQLPLPPERKQEFLEEIDVTIRARELIAALEAISTEERADPNPDRKFPPEFSVN